MLLHVCDTNMTDVLVTKRLGHRHIDVHVRTQEKMVSTSQGERPQES
jgi:predicted HAD superfamily phosphohydrolase YqeG